MRKLTKEEFIERAKKVHGDKYDYSKVEYVNNNVKVCVVCHKHGYFYIKPANLLSGQGCKFCGIENRASKRRLTKEEFIERAKKVHGDKYDYSKVEYLNCDIPVRIICPEHGEFSQTPYNHINSSIGCSKCANNVKYTTDEFIKKAKEIHCDKYNYSLTKYNGSFEKVCIVCPEHGEFWQTASAHLTGCGCPMCKGKNKTNESFIEELKKIHGDKYDYSLVNYSGAYSPIRLICKKHGEFISIPHTLLNGCGCKKCGQENTHEKQKLETAEFIKKSIEKHGHKYDYSKSEYINAKTKVCITCPKHGDFYIAPNAHISSKNGGCPKCSETSLEREIRVICENNQIEFVQQKTFPWLRNLKLDFYLPKYNIAIECQGIYHFEPRTSRNKNLTDEEVLLQQIHRDELKYKILNDNNITLLYYIPSNLISKTKISKIYKDKSVVFTKASNLLDFLETKL